MSSLVIYAGENGTLPTLQQLCDEVCPYTNKLHQIAIGLGLSLVHIERIWKQECHQVENSFIKVFEEWKKQCKHPYTWQTMIRVLRSPCVCEHRLAEELCKKYCVHLWNYHLCTLKPNIFSPYPHGKIVLFILLLFSLILYYCAKMELHVNHKKFCLGHNLLGGIRLCLNSILLWILLWR